MHIHKNPLKISTRLNWPLLRWQNGSMYTLAVTCTTSWQKLEGCKSNSWGVHNNSWNTYTKVWYRDFWIHRVEVCSNDALLSVSVPLFLYTPWFWRRIFQSMEKSFFPSWLMQKKDLIKGETKNKRQSPITWPTDHFFKHFKPVSTKWCIHQSSQLFTAYFSSLGSLCRRLHSFSKNLLSYCYTTLATEGWP